MPSRATTPAVDVAKNAGHISEPSYTPINIRKLDQDNTYASPDTPSTNDRVYFVLCNSPESVDTSSKKPTSLNAQSNKRSTPNDHIYFQLDNTMQY